MGLSHTGADIDCDFNGKLQQQKIHPRVILSPLTLEFGIGARVRIKRNDGAARGSKKF